MEDDLAAQREKKRKRTEVDELNGGPETEGSSAGAGMSQRRTRECSQRRLGRDQGDPMSWRHQEASEGN